MPWLDVFVRLKGRLGRQQFVIASTVLAVATALLSALVFLSAPRYLGSYVLGLVRNNFFEIPLELQHAAIFLLILSPFVLITYMFVAVLVKRLRFRSRSVFWIVPIVLAVNTVASKQVWNLSLESLSVLAVACVVIGIGIAELVFKPDDVGDHQ